MTAGQPVEGGVPSGSVSEQASWAPSDIGSVSCCGVAADAEPAESSMTSAARKTTRRPTRATG